MYHNYKCFIEIQNHLSVFDAILLVLEYNIIIIGTFK